MLWEVDIYPAESQVDRAAARLAADAADLDLAHNLRAAVAAGYLLSGDLDLAAARRVANELLTDTVVERAVVGPPRELGAPPRFLQDFGAASLKLVNILPKPGVMDPVAQSAAAAIRDLGVKVDEVRTFKKYWLADLDDARVAKLCGKLLANDAIEQVVIGALNFDHLEVGSAYQFRLVTVAIRAMSDDELMTLSRRGQLYLSLAEMRTIREHFAALDRDPTDAELETIAQTWSEHCSHKTLKGRIRYRDDRREINFENMLKETIFAATVEVRRRLGDQDWCVSVFADNAGVVRFDERHHAVFKVETHNHPSALEPYGGANTGLGGVIRDPLGTGLGAKPVASTDVFCFAPHDTPANDLPVGVLHPMRVLRGVVSGVRDYGNRMGIPTVNGAVYFDPRYLGNPLVFCGNLGLLPVDKVEKRASPGDHIVAVGGRTGRDGIHGATFSSAELTSESEKLSGGAVQIGNAITEKMLLDVVLAARDEGLFTAITDCGAGGFSSAVGEMGETIGAEVWLDRVPLKYQGLSYTEIWISEAQERMVLAVSPEKWERFEELCRLENVEATVIGQFVPTKKLTLKYGEAMVAQLDMSFLHDGRPPVVREAVYQPPPETPQPLPDKYTWDYTPELMAILGSANVASKEWIIRQYDHEVQGGSVVKPLVGVEGDGPSDAAVLRPDLDSSRGLVVSCGMNPRYSDFDTYHMAASAIDEAMRNCVAVGADPSRVAILDNFCWGDCEKPETLGSLVRAALACHDVAIELGTPFVSGKDSLNNEFRHTDTSGQRQSIAIPPSLLISALGQIADARQAVTMDLKESGNFLYQVGATKNEMGGSHFALVEELSGGSVPRVDVALAKKTFAALHAAIAAGAVRACHDLSEGGLAVAVAEMAFAGGLGARVFLAQAPHAIEADEDAHAARVDFAKLARDEPLHALAGLSSAAAILLFSESNSRFLCEVRPEETEAFERAMAGVPCSLVGEVVDTGRLEILGIPRPMPSGEPGEPAEMMVPLLVSAELRQLKQAWQGTLRF